jgi:hypothetical protein
LNSVARLLARLGSLLLMKRVRGLRVGSDGMMLELEMRGGDWKRDDVLVRSR